MRAFSTSHANGKPAAETGRPSPWGRSWLEGASRAEGSPKVIQRACACGGDGASDVGCDDCPGIQAKLAVNEPGDADEQQADQLAHQVMRMPDPLPPPGNPNSLSRPRAARDFHDPGASGRPMPESLRAFFEPRFGHDFRRVRVHTDAEAGQTAGALHARAFTLGNDVVFSAGEYAPDTPRGRLLLAHELAHVVQQRSGAARLARKKNPHDGKPTRCGGLGKLEFEGPVDVMGALKAVHGTDAIIVAVLPKLIGGTWIRGVQTPPNQVKGGKKRGFLDGLKVQLGTAFTGDVVEVKARSKRGGGGAQATLEAKQYVTDLNAISPRIAAVSRAAHEAGGLDSKFSKPVRAALKKQGVDLGLTPDAQAYSFYLSVQKQLPDLPKRDYSGFSFALSSDGTYGETYVAMRAPTTCKRKKKTRVGKGYLEFQLNQQGGASYGCRTECDEEEEKKKKRKKRAAVAEVPQPAVAHTQGIDPIFHVVLREAGLQDEIQPQPDRIVAVTLARPLYQAILDALAFQRSLAAVMQNQAPFKGSALQQGILGSTIIAAVTAAGLTAAITISALAPAAGLAGATAEAAAVTAAASETAAGVGAAAGAAAVTTELVALPLSTVAANTNAVAIAAGVALFIGYRMGTEPGAAAAIEAGFANPEFMSVFDPGNSPVPVGPGSEVQVNGQSHQVVFVG